MLRTYLFSDAELVRMLRFTTLSSDRQDVFLATLNQMRFSLAAWMYNVLAYYMVGYEPFTESVENQHDYDYVFSIFTPVQRVTASSELDIRVVKHYNNPEGIGILEQLDEVCMTDELYNMIGVLHPPLTDESSGGAAVLSEHLNLFMDVTDQLVKSVEQMFLQRQTNGSHSHVVFSLRANNLLVFVH